MEMNPNNDLNHMNEEVPQQESKNIYYNCPECQSAIEIVESNDEVIKFNCNNNHNIVMKIKEYLDKLKENKEKMILNVDIKPNKPNSEICNEHKKVYATYCIECNEHLCNDCLKAGKHAFHYKINIIEIKPENDILTKIGNFIETNSKERKNLIKNQKELEEKTKKILNENINKINKIKRKNKRKNSKSKDEEKKKNKDKYKKDLENLKIEYNKKIKNIKMKYNNDANSIDNKYKTINDNIENIYNNKINKLKKKMNILIDNCGYNEKINKITNLNELIKIIYKAYTNNNNNYYNVININNIYKNYFNIDSDILKLKENHNIIQNYKTKLKDKENAQNSIINNYKSKINDQNNIIKNNETKINEQNSIIKDYESKINEQNNIINDYESKLNVKENEKNNIIKNYESKINEQENEKNNIINDYEAKINDYNNIIKIIEKDNKINDNESKINLLIKDLVRNKNIIKIIYTNSNNENEIRIFGNKFVSNNKNNCKILYNNKILDLKTEFNVENINQLEIELNGILNITSMEYMFNDCKNLTFLPDIHLIILTILLI